MRDEGGSCADALVLSSPWVDVTMSNPMIRQHEQEDPVLSVAALEQSAQPYAGLADPRDPFISPLFGDPTGLPPMLVYIGTREIFLWENRQWAQRCYSTGTSCRLVEVPGGFHTVGSVTMVPEGRKAVQDQASFLTQHAATMKDRLPSRAHREHRSAHGEGPPIALGGRYRKDGPVRKSAG